jgi:hypothetical protein
VAASSLKLSVARGSHGDAGLAVIVFASNPSSAGETFTMSEAKMGQEFITHEFDEAIAVQQTIVDAERQLSANHPAPDAKKRIQASLREDERHLDKLMKLGKEHGATGKVEEVAGSLQQLMQQTAQKAAEAESEAYEATAVLINLKRKQQDSASAMLKMARSMRDTKMRDAAQEFHKATKTSADELSKELAAFAVTIAKMGTNGGSQTSRSRGARAGTR